MSELEHTGHMDDCPHAIGQPAWCRVCADAGPEGTPFFDEEALSNLDTVATWVDTLNLNDWTIRMGDGFVEELEEDAYVRKERNEKVATIYIDPRANDTQWERLLVHELLHLVFDDLQFLASNDRPVHVMDQVHTALERTINVLSTALTGHQWEPINQVVRDRHEFDV